MKEQSTDRPPLHVRLCYGFGAVAYGVKNSGFDFFLLFFYGTVLGVDPALVGLAIFLALLLDAFSDPIVGYLSDNLRSSWGRRHPFMYASALPVALSYFLLWNPPDAGEMFLFFYMLTLAIIIRTAITFYETPSSALMPELTPNYEQRTVLQSWRLFFGWVGGNFMTVLMFGVLLVPSAQFADGMQNLDGYSAYGIISSIVIFISIMVCALGTHGRARVLPKAETSAPKANLGTIFAGIFETFRDKSFFSLFMATLFGAVASGVVAALFVTLLTYFWGLSAEERFLYSMATFISATIGLVIATPLVKWLGKRNAVVLLGVFAFSIAPLPVLLRLLGFMPANGDPSLFPLLVSIHIFDVSLIIALQAILYSMAADLVEAAELRTGKRSEGMFYAAITFTRKSTLGFGGAIAGLMLAYVSFPEGDQAASVSDETLWQLGAIYVPTLLVLWSCMLIAISFYKIDKTSHEAALRELEEGTV